MAANITITWTGGSNGVQADGKTVVGTLSGGTGTGYAITNANGLQPHTSGGTSIVPTATPSIVGSTITVALPAEFLSTDTVQFNVAAANTIVDDGGNTGAVATNAAVRNVSALTGTSTDIVSNLSKFNFNGALTNNGSSVSDYAAMVGAYSMEWVIEVTSGTVSVAIEAYVNTGFTLGWQVDGVAGSAAGHNVGYEMFGVAASLGVGRHVIRHNCPSNYYTRSVRLAGGTATIVTVPCPVALFKDNVAGLTAANVVSKAKRWGTQRVSGNMVSNTHPGFQFHVAVNASGLDVLGYASVSGTFFAVAVDSGAVPAAIVSYGLQGFSTDVANNNSYQIQPVVAGLAPGSHTVEVLDLTMNGWQCIRAYNGSKLASAASAGASTISVPDITHVAVGDWFCLDHVQNEEVVKVTAIAGTGPYTLTLASALSKAHAAGAALRNFAPATAPTMSDGTAPTFAGRLVATGDSITHAEAISTTNTFPASGYLGYDLRASYALMAARAANFELIHGATQGWVSGQVVSNNAANNADANKPATVYHCLIGTNDFGSANTPLATYQTNIESIIGQGKTAAPAGAKILLSKVFSPITGTTNAGGNTRADFDARQLAAIANTSSGYAGTIRQIDIARSVNRTSSNADVPDNVHPSIAGTTISGTGGQNKMANEFLPHLAGYAFGLSSSSGATGNAVTLTATLNAGAKFVSADTMSVAVTGAATGTVTLTPSVGGTTATGTFTPTVAGTHTFTPDNGQGWTNDSAQAFTATSADTTAPTLSTANINSAGTTLTLTYSESVTGVSAADYTLSGGATLSSASGSGTSWTMTISPAVGAGQTRTLSYSGTGTKDGANNLLATFSGASVTNNSTADQTPPNCTARSVGSAGTPVVFTFDENIAVSGLDSATLTFTGTAAVYQSHTIINGNELHVTVSPVIRQGESPVDVYLGDDSITDTLGNSPATNVSGSIENGSTVPPEDEAVYPDPADVRSGVEYGPTGADYTGTYVGGGSGAALADVMAATTGYTTTLYVSPTGSNADDGLAPSTAKQTLAAAQAAATAPAQIRVLAGTYNEAGLGKDGVDWHLSHQTLIRYTGNVAQPVFGDFSVAKRYAITGSGRIVNASVAGGGGSGSRAAIALAAASTVRVEADELRSESEQSPNACGIVMEHASATITADIRKVSAAAYDAMVITAGTLYLRANLVRSELDGSALETGGADAKVYIDADEIACAAGNSLVEHVEAGHVDLSVRRMTGGNLYVDSGTMVVRGGTLIGSVQMDGGSITLAGVNVTGGASIAAGATVQADATTRIAGSVTGTGTLRRVGIVSGGTVDTINEPIETTLPPEQQQAIVDDIVAGVGAGGGGATAEELAAALVARGMPIEIVPTVPTVAKGVLNDVFAGDDYTGDRAIPIPFTHPDDLDGATLELRLMRRDVYLRDPSATADLVVSAAATQDDEGRVDVRFPITSTQSAALNATASSDGTTKYTALVTRGGDASRQTLCRLEAIVRRGIAVAAP